MMNNLELHKVTRRGFIKKFATGAATLALSAAVLGGGWTSPVSAGTGVFKTTAALNLRSQANTTSAVILVIPKGEQVTQVGPT